MIELAPNSKTGLSLRSPFLLGSAAVGWGDAWPPGVEPGWFGALVTPPLTLQGRRGMAGPRLAEIPGGFILNTGDHNPGLRRVLRDDVVTWDSLGLPVIVALAGSAPDDWLRLGERLEEIGIAALEAQLPAGVTPREAGGWIANLKRGCQLPVLAKVRATNAVLLAEVCRGCWRRCAGRGDAAAGRCAGARRSNCRGPSRWTGRVSVHIAGAAGRGRAEPWPAADRCRRDYDGRRCADLLGSRRGRASVAKRVVDRAGHRGNTDRPKARSRSRSRAHIAPPTVQSRQGSCSAPVPAR